MTDIQLLSVDQINKSNSMNFRRVQQAKVTSEVIRHEVPGDQNRLFGRDEVAAYRGIIPPGS
jgi:hypothetical protein